jgi:flagellar hook protein FlgE
MLRSMNAGVSGLRSHQTMMDVVGNNIANVNTTGFKSSSVNFTDLLSQMLRGSGAPNDERSGSNPAQVGLGVKVSGISTNFAQGASQLTGRSADISIQGDGFLLAREGGETYYTRNGNLQVDLDGILSTIDGAYIQGWQADIDGTVNTAATPTNIQVPITQIVAPQQTVNVVLGGNLESTRPLTDVVNTQITTYDDQGRPLDLLMSIQRTGTNTWSVQPRNAVDNSVIGAPATVTWAPATNTWSPAVTISAAALNASLPAPLATRNFINPIAVDFSRVTQFGSATSLASTTQDGYQEGALQSFNIGVDGTLSGSFTNGQTRVLAQLALAAFNNPAGLEKVGGSLFRQSVNSGLPQIGTAETGGRGLLSSGTLEMSNVDLAQEFTNLIIAQRGFQANSRIISASDEILQDLVNIKR